MCRRSPSRRAFREIAQKRGAETSTREVTVTWPRAIRAVCSRARPGLPEVGVTVARGRAWIARLLGKTETRDEGDESGGGGGGGSSSSVSAVLAIFLAREGYEVKQRALSSSLSRSLSLFVVRGLVFLRKRGFSGGNGAL